MYSKRKNLRDEVLIMKRTVFALVALLALLAGIVPAKSQTVPGQPAPKVTNTFESAAKLTVKKPPATEMQPAKDVMIRLVIPASPHAEGRMELVKAKRAFYYDGRIVSAVLAANDPRSGRPFLSLAAHEGVYVLRTSGVTAVSVGHGGVLVWRESYIETADSGKLEVAVKRIETACDGEMLNETLLKLRDANRIDLAPAGPRYFFEGPGAHGPVFIPVIQTAEMTKNILRLGVRTPVTQKVVSFWVDLEARKVVKCVADGKELDLSIDRSGFGIPPENESKTAPQ